MKSCKNLISKSQNILKSLSVKNHNNYLFLSVYKHREGLKKHWITTLGLALIFVAFTFPVIVSAQSVSGVTGIITDSTGAVIPGVDVKLTDTKTSKEFVAKADDQGVYLFQNIPPGIGYKLTFTIQGFQTSVINNVSLGVGKTETYNTQLTTGQVSETVEISSSTDVTLNTTDSSIGNVISSRQMRELPIQIRNSPAALIGLQPGVVGNNVGTTSTNRVGSVTGSRADQGNITVDGIDANDQATGQAFATVGNAAIDSIQEFRAVSSNPNSSEGRSSGGQIQLVTKSGTNEFHGSLREYNRTALTSANSFFNNKNGVKRPQLTRNQFGGSIGGPLPFFNFGEGGPMFTSGKDKLFFFFDYEGRRDAQGVTYTRIVPLNHVRNGELGYINNTSGCATNSRLNTTPQCITILSRSQVAALDPKGIGANQALLDFINQRYPQANDLTVGDGINTGGFTFNAPSRRGDNTYTTRIDWNATANQKLFGRFNIVDTVVTDTTNSVAQQFPGDPETAQIVLSDHSWVVGHSWVVTPTFFNQITVGNSHSGLDFQTNFKPSSPNLFTFAPTTTSFSIARPFTPFSEQSRSVDTPTIRDDATWNINSHSIQFGAQFKPIRSVSRLVNDFNNIGVGLGGANFTLSPSLRPSNIRPGTTAANNFDVFFPFLLGRIGSISTGFTYDTSRNANSPGTGRTTDFRYNEYEFYAQDNWRIRKDLTVNFGVRWQFYPAPYEANGFQTASNIGFDDLLNRRLQNAASGTSGPNAEPLFVYTLTGKKNNGAPYYDSDWNNFAPRIGFAYNPSFETGFLGKLFGNRKTSIRGGGTLVYDRVGGALSFLLDQSTYLFDSSATTNFGNSNPVLALLNDPRFTGINSLPLQNVPPPISNPATPGVENGIPVGTGESLTNYVISRNFRVPYSIQYSLGIQRELPGNFFLDVSYVGRQGRKLFAQADASQILNFRDNGSGQLLFDALNALQRELQADVPLANITAQPWFENQISSALGAPCSVLGTTSCTRFVAQNLGGLVEVGDASDTVQILYQNGFLNPNVGLSSQFATNAYVTNFGSSSYNGMLVSLQKGFSQGFQFDFNYTWSHSIDNQSNVANTVFGGLVCDITNLRICRADSDFDIRHLINVNGIFELPLGRGKYFAGNAPSWLNTIIGNWTISGIYTYRSGLPFSTTTGSFPVSFVTDSPAVSTGNASALLAKIHNDGSSIQFFNDLAAARNAFRNPNNGEMGTRNNLRSSGFWNVDLALLKNFKLPWESQKIQLRAEAYNAFNHNVFGIPNTNFNSSNFGLITTSVSTPRVMQFALRYEF